MILGAQEIADFSFADPSFHDTHSRFLKFNSRKSKPSSGKPSDFCRVISGKQVLSSGHHRKSAAAAVEEAILRF